MTPGEKEISRIYEDEIYSPPDMIEKPVVETSDSDSELEELLRDTPEPGTPSIADSRVSFNSRSSLDN